MTDTTQQTNRVLRDGRVPSSPLARRMCEENGLDLTHLWTNKLITASGPDDRVVKTDVESYLLGLNTQNEIPASASPAQSQQQGRFTKHADGSISGPSSITDTSLYATAWKQGLRVRSPLDDIPPAPGGKTGFGIG